MADFTSRAALLGAALLLAACQTTPAVDVLVDAPDRVTLAGSSHFLPSDGALDALFDGVVAAAADAGAGARRTTVTGNGGGVALVCRLPEAERRARDNGFALYLEPTAALIGRLPTEGERALCAERVDAEFFVIGEDSARTLRFAGPTGESERKERDVVVLLARRDHPAFQDDLPFLRYLLSDATIGPGAPATDRGFLPASDAARGAIRAHFEDWAKSGQT